MHKDACAAEPVWEPAWRCLWRWRPSGVGLGWLAPPGLAMGWAGGADDGSSGALALPVPGPGDGHDGPWRIVGQSGRVTAGAAGDDLAVEDAWRQ
ncbi:hypothetical protein DSL92_04535 [Billgrantia gudaonensis]|uniref:Uncharacterized protein n=1 Tax=Billgrantia gudaonensis TaxID=376427 RepID=A0A3S0NEW6_9GAMM|nr:hypothetical protein DSL92_04535 [Halomonas gudaonensis]